MERALQIAAAMQQTKSENSAENSASPFAVAQPVAKNVPKAPIPVPTDLWAFEGTRGKTSRYHPTRQQPSVPTMVQRDVMVAKEVRTRLVGDDSLSFVTFTRRPRRIAPAAPIPENESPRGG